MLNKWLAGITLGICLNIISCSNSSSLDENVVIVVVNNEEILLDQFKRELKVHKKKFSVQG